MRPISLCESCEQLRIVKTPKGSRFLLCRRSQTEVRYPKYPPQPVHDCLGYAPATIPAGSTSPREAVP